MYEIVAAIAYLTAWRVFLRWGRAERRSSAVVTAFALILGVAVGEWWASALAAVNAAIALTFGPREPAPGDAVVYASTEYRRDVLLFATVEAGVIALGVLLAKALA